jgi:hypothetical protein
MMMHKIKRTNNSNKGDFPGSLQWVIKDIGVSL